MSGSSSILLGGGPSSAASSTSLADFERTVSESVAQLQRCISAEVRRAVVGHEKELQTLRDEIVGLQRSLGLTEGARTEPVPRKAAEEAAADAQPDALQGTTSEGLTGTLRERSRDQPAQADGEPAQPSLKITLAMRKSRAARSGMGGSSPIGCTKTALSLQRMTTLQKQGAYRGSQEVQKTSTTASASKVSFLQPDLDGTDEANAFNEDVAFRIRSVFSDPGKLSQSLAGSPTRIMSSDRDLDGQERPSKYALAPTCIFRLVFEWTSVFLLLYDAIMTPLIVAWNPKADFYQAMSAVTVVFWFLDLLLNFFTGYYNEGEVVMQLPRIARHYLRTWFVPDVLINSVDIATLIFELLSDGDSSYSRAAPLAMRAGRILKINKLLRIFVFMRRLRERVGLVIPPQLQVVGLGTKLVITLLWCNHVICCLWYFIGENGATDTGYTWLDLSLKTGDGTYRDVPMLYQYSTSLHWSITQMTPGSMAVVPQNSIERFFNVACLFVGLFVGALLVSQLSARMVKMQLENQEQHSRMANLNAYLVENKIGWNVRTRVHHQIAERVNMQKRLTPKDVPLLNVLSTSLKKEVCFASFAHHLMSHTLFCAWGNMDRKLLESICLHAVELVSLSIDDDLFTPHTEADKVYLVMKGVLRYSTDDSPAIRCLWDYMKEMPGDMADPGTWVSEVALWLEWSYVGTLTSVTKCELLAIRVPILLEHLTKNHKVRALNYHYARAFIRMITEGDLEVDADLSVNVEHLLMAMPLEWRMIIQEPLVNLVYGDSTSSSMGIGWTRSHNPAMNAQDELMKELNAGKAIVSIDKNKVSRTVLLVTLRLQNTRTSNLLVRLAKDTADKGLVAAPSLPGTKMMQSEDPMEAIQRLLHSDFLSMQPKIKIVRVMTNSEYSFSETYKIPTKYMISSFVAEYSNGTSTKDVLRSSNTSNRSVNETKKHTGRKTNLFRLSGLLRGQVASVASTDPSNLLHVLDTCECFLLESPGGSGGLYAWLPEEYLAHAKAPKGLEVLSHWIEDNAESFSAFTDKAGTESMASGKQDSNGDDYSSEGREGREVLDSI